jgi:hypothetical protein
MVTVTCLGIFFGAVAAWRKSVLPGMLMHAAFNLLAVFARRLSYHTLDGWSSSRRAIES